MTSKQRVLTKLKTIVGDQARERDPILVELNKCKEAYEAGKMMEDAFHRIAATSAFGEERILPTAGLVMPPIV